MPTALGRGTRSRVDGLLGQYMPAQSCGHGTRATKKPVEFGPVDVEGLNPSGNCRRVINTSNGLVPAQIDGENGSGSRDRSRHGKLREWWATGVVW